MTISNTLKAELIRKSLHFGVVFGHLLIASFINFWLAFSFLILGLIVVYFFRETKLSLIANSTRKSSWGQYYLFLGLIITNLLYLFFPNQNALIFSYFAIGISDILAGFVTYFKASKKMTKTNSKVPESSYLFGSIAFAVLNFIFLVFLESDFPLARVLIIGLYLTLIEFYSRKGLDNFSVPLFSYILVNVPFWSFLGLF